MRVSLGIPHAGWRADRRALMALIREKLAVSRIEPLVTEAAQALGTPLNVELRRGYDGAAMRIVYHEQRDVRPTPVWDWSARIWARIASADADVAMLLQDDVEICADFWSALGAMWDAAGGEVVSLHQRWPGARARAQAGEPFVTAFGCPGVAWAMPMVLFRDFLAWIEREFVGDRRAVTEDALMDGWLLMRRRRVWVPTVAIVRHVDDHDALAGDAGEYLRDTTSDWRGFERVTDPTWWRGGPRPPRHVCFGGDARPGVPRRVAVGLDGARLRV